MKFFIFLFLSIFLTGETFSQLTDTGIVSDSLLLAGRLPDKFFTKVSEAHEKSTARVQKANTRLLKQLQGYEEKLFKGLAVVDTQKSREGLENTKAAYDNLRQKLAGKSASLEQGGGYIARMDSLNTMLKFLQPLTDKKEGLVNAVSGVAGMKNSLAQANDIQAFIAERQAMLKGITGKFKSFPDGLKSSMDKYLGSYGKQTYYYKQEVLQYKEALKDPEKAERLALKVLNKLPAFQKFMRQHGELASMFGPAPDGPSGNSTSLAGLQTRASVEQLIQQQLGASGAGPQSYVREQIQSGQGQLGKLKDKAEALKNGDVGSGGDSGMPDFKPNNQKVKPFLKRLEYGWNLQSGISVIPVAGSAVSTWKANDLAVSAGYKFHDRLVAGVAVAYKFGLGTGWKNITFTHEGVGFRSYIDWKLSSPQKGVKALFTNIWLSGGYEKNYLSKFKDIPELKKAAWQTSGLIGISKRIRYKRNEAKVSMLYDFIKKRLPGEGPLVIRVGYQF